MKYLPLLISLLLSLSSIAQITITLEDMPNAGDTLRHSIAGVDSITQANYTATGENYIWDFSHINPTQQRVAAYNPAWQTPYALYFLGLDKYGTAVIDTLGFGQFMLTNIYEFYQRKATAFESEGRGFQVNGIPIPAYYSDDDEIYQFPLEYGDRDSSTFAFEASIPSLFNYRSEGYRINTVDGWGTIKTPYGSFECSRIVSDIISLDTVAFNGFQLGFRNARREYKWLAKGEAFPILEISGLPQLFNSDGFAPTTIRYRDDYRFIESSLAPTADFEASSTTLTQQDTLRLRSLTPDLPSNQYTWAISPNTFVYVNGTDANSRSPSLVFTENGSYDVALQVRNNFGEASSTKVDYITVGISGTNELSNKYKLSIHPNPISEGVFRLNYTLPSLAEIQVALYDIKGQKIQTLLQTQQSGSQEQYFQLKTLAPDLYFLNIQIDGQQQAFAVVVK